MPGRVFVDTNVAVYVFDYDSPKKQQVARGVFAVTEAELVVSTQVLSEFYVTVTKKLGSPLDAESACEAVRHLSELDVVGVDAELVGAAIELHQAHSVSYWDALIVESAARAGCGTILTEDLNHGSTLRGAAIINPFVD